MQWIFPIIAILTGLIIGSFLNVVIHRGPALWRLVEDDRRQGNLALPGSYCPACKAPIHPMNLIPVFSFLFLHGKCAACSASISIRYPIVEILGGGSALGAYILFGPSIAGFLAALFFWFMIALAFIDLETGFLPDVITLPLIALGLGANAISTFVLFSAALIGAGAGYFIFRIIGEIFSRWRGIEGLGQGDAKLLAAIGAWLGWQALAPAVFLAALLGLVVIFITRIAGKEITSQTPVPFGPALAASSAIILAVSTLSSLPTPLEVIFP